MKNGPCTDSNLSNPLAAPPRIKKLEKPPLLQALNEYNELQRRRYHVPAHAGFNLLPHGWDVLQDHYRNDLSEVEGLDILSEPSGSLRDAQARVAELFGVQQSFFLVNGASVGLMAAMLSALKPGDQILLPRNVHRSVISGLILTGAQPIWFLPDYLPQWGLWGAVTIAQVQTQLQRYPDIKALLLTSPTYEGIGSNVAELLQLCRKHQVLLMVDEAHGGLWPFSEHLPESAVHVGADAVIHSMHKCGGSLTQSALAHLPHGSQIDPGVFQQALNTLQTTSPSYLLMASLEAAVHALVLPEGEARLSSLLEQVAGLRQRLHAELKHFRLSTQADAHGADWDSTRLYLMNPTECAEEWGARLEAEQGLAYESAANKGVLYLANLGLNSEDLDYLVNCLLAEDIRLTAKFASCFKTEGLEPAAQEASEPIFDLPKMAMLPRAAFFASGKKVSRNEALGCIAKETIVHCPPGIPVLLPGEIITRQHLLFLPAEGVMVVELPFGGNRI
jgi:arginine decarboxylase